MINGFNGGVIDVSSVVMIINKLQLYIENEERILLDIKNSLLMLEDYYSSDNNKVLKSKKDNLYNTLNTVLENRKKYIEYLNHVVNSYIDLDEKSMLSFNTDIS